MNNLETQELKITDFDEILIRITPEEYINLLHYVDKYENMLQNNRSRQKNKYKTTIHARRPKPNIRTVEAIKDEVVYEITYD